jgi:hypothetical protein
VNNKNNQYGMMRNNVAQKQGNKFSELQLTQGVALLMQGLEKSSSIIHEDIELLLTAVRLKSFEKYGGYF